MQYLIEATAYDSDAGAEVVHRWSSAGFTTRPDDTPANTVYEPRVIDPGNWEAHLFSGYQTRGRSDSAAGAVEINNADGALDALWSQGWGRPIRILVGPDTAADLSDFTLIQTNTSVGVERVGRTRLRILMQDKQSLIADRVMNDNKFLGTNSGATGVEGLPEDLKGKPKPRLYGECASLPVPQANSSAVVHQISDSRVSAITVQAVNDRGVAITAGTTYGSLSSLLSSSPTAGTYNAYLGSSSDGAYIKFGSSPAGAVTVNATEGTNASDRTVAQCVKRILKGPGLLTDSDLDLSSFTSLDAANSSIVGYWSGIDDDTVGNAVDALCASIGAFWRVKEDGTISVGRLEAPDPGSSVLTLSDGDGGEILTDGFELQPSADTDHGTPPWRILVDYARNFYVFNDADFAGAVTDQTTRNRLKQEYARTAPAESATLRSKHPLSKEFVATTLLRSASAAATERDRLAALYQTEREIVVCPLSVTVAYQVALNNTVTLQSDRFGWSAGKSFRVIGRIHEYATSKITLILWG
ncbi:hypothetical protein TSA6c_00480 [Azospirillum sp. TSA6c]|uniref:hypothetical protein n=1 Tax=Azospirillum sp. TSA6c TaxID=709813 RepID=UPI000D608A75|nr:hypothetical protein [Azospirillum sp. TSA6c]PWC54375.1 hypothetical protein TSA6c_00480 [Azospirillum sp. TSA6c]